MFRKVLFVLTLVVIGSSSALVQTGHAQSPGALFEHKVEFHAFGGYIWSSGRAANVNGQNGDIDLESSEWLGFALDITLPVPGTQLELLYTRQDTNLLFKPNVGITETLSPIIAEFWHIGGVYSRFAKGKVVPFTSFTLGTTRYIVDTRGVDDSWKFSIALGAGVKAYLNEKLGIRAQIRMPVTFLSTGIGIGTGGLSVGGSGIFGFDISGGVFLAL